MNKSMSESNLSEGSNENTTKKSSQRNKRLREEDLPGEFYKFKEEMRELISSFMNAQQNQISSILMDLKEIQNTNNSINNSVMLLTKQNEDFCKKIELLQSQIKQDREYISILENKIEDLQRSSRKTSIEIKNAPKNKQESREDLLKMVMCLAKSVDLVMDVKDIKDIFRLSERKERGVNNPPIILELGSTLLKIDLLKKIKLFNSKNKSKLQAMHLGFTINEHNPIYITEQLTSKAARLFFLARDLVKMKNYKYCWTSFGKVFVRQDESSRIIQVTTEPQVHQLLQKP
ncbi:unnamed protein product [Diatraea saccharalis]|uniref:FP protein C-terminal domain-containing protein n=1 Tax=Diatraea saccharalis TaxID=40085 RepID=A0A9N9R7I2_9NEOP|nr:unnamed protein product [Diatraea saccharalis]